MYRKMLAEALLRPSVLIFQHLNSYINPEVSFEAGIPTPNDALIPDEVRSILSLKLMVKFNKDDSRKIFNNFFLSIRPDKRSYGTSLFLLTFLTRKSFAFLFLMFIYIYIYIYINFLPHSHLQPHQYHALP
ncbi:hypothetical protein L6452_05905 [Arctium lappa]|uniref:Uncharacterized protein n=1 Tax=Arctium lappa TaxID=4217 RepID=A0ACB9EI53_ARCLA|nr:hypothetical protein L6452_05905 [Arctium lappa]